MLELIYTPPGGEPRVFERSGRPERIQALLDHYRTRADQWPGTFEVVGEPHPCWTCDGYEQTWFWSKGKPKVVPCRDCLKAGRIKRQCRREER